ncbi:hypothetical protein [Streptomyces sp. C10-9-1]|uniref:hypothetical protein n=1 Tax=Streptomyces sp. C10-9-1 TaxID=1859285 RepID=UPI003D7144AD
MTTDMSVACLPPVGHRFASDGGGREVFGHRLELALNTVYNERCHWPWGMLAASRLLTELRLRVDEQTVFVPLLDRLRDGVPVGRPSTQAACVEDVADQMAKSIRVMLGDAEAGEVLSEAADYAYAAVLRSRTWRKGERAAFQQRTAAGQRATAARPKSVYGGSRSRPGQPSPREMRGCELYMSDSPGGSSVSLRLCSQFSSRKPRSLCSAFPNSAAANAAVVSVRTVPSTSICGPVSCWGWVSIGVLRIG